MKKIISVLLAALMLMSCFGMVSSAADKILLEGTCNCGGDHDPVNPCHCCIFCENLDMSYVTSCVKKSMTETGEKYVCCYDCSGMRDCGCDCSCCKVIGDEDVNQDDSMLDDVITEQDKENFVDGFQAILKQISDFFDMVFDAIFEFLRLDEVLGRGDI